MGFVYKKQVTKPLPPGAEVQASKGERIARWKDATGKSHTARVTIGRDGLDRIVIHSRTYTAKYRDAAGVLREVATGCRDQTAAKARLAELERRTELVKAGVLTAGEDAVAEHQCSPLRVHVDDYIAHLEFKGVHRDRVNATRSRLNRVAGDCGFRCLADLSAKALESWLGEQKTADMSAGTRNGYREAWLGFGNWCVSVSQRRVLENPFRHVPKADAKADCRRKRRALTEDELIRLLDVARTRPLTEALIVRRGRRKGQLVANVRPEVRETLQHLGWERALIYKTMVLTGLRKNELASLTFGQLHLDAPRPYLELDAADEKNREGSSIPLRGIWWPTWRLGLPTSGRNTSPPPPPSGWRFALLWRNAPSLACRCFRSLTDSLESSTET